MLRGETVTAVIPARRGSKGIPKKNLYRMGRDTLLERAIKISELCSVVDNTVVSTDDPIIDQTARGYGVAAPSLRPKQLAGDTASSVDVVVDLIENLPISTGWILLLQVTTPLRTLSDLNAFFECLEKADGDVDASVSLVKIDSPHPDKIQKIEEGFVKSYLGKVASVARQSLPSVYALNGAFYLVRKDILLRERTFIPFRTVPFVMSADKSINLDTPTDLRYLEMMINSGFVEIEEYSLEKK